MSESTLKRDVLIRYLSKTFIETGTAKGECVLVALEAGFKNVITIEANPKVFMDACKRFADDDRVTTVLGDSGKVLPDILSGINEPATFWLDAHWSTGEDDLGPSISKCPILYDLRAIGLHHVKNHIILIDDIRYFRSGGLPQWEGVNLGDIMQVILDINPGYRIAFENGFMANDVLAARVVE